MSQRYNDRLEKALERLAYAVLWDLVLMVLNTYVVLMLVRKTDVLFPWKALILMGFIYWFSISVLSAHLHYVEKKFQSPISLFFKILLSVASIGGSIYALPSALTLEAWLVMEIPIDTPVLMAFVVGFASTIIGLIFLTMRAQRSWEDQNGGIIEENLEKLRSLVFFKISNVSHNLKIPAPSVDLQVTVNNNSIFDVKLKKFIYKPNLLGIRGSLSERTFDHEIKIPHQSSNRFETNFEIPNGIAKHLENCKRYANGGKHGQLTWHFSCTAYFVGPEGEFSLPQRTNYYKEWYKIELPREREV